MTAAPSASTLPDLAARQKTARALKKDPSGDTGVCDGFRIPDQAVVRFRCTPQEVSKLSMSTVQIFEGGSCITSYFWLVPNASIDGFLGMLDQATTAILPKGFNPAPDDGVMTCVWQHKSCDMSLVGWLAAGDWAALFDGHPQVTIKAFPGVTPLMYGGNDNGPCMIFDEWPAGKLLEPSVEKMIKASITKDALEEAVEVWAEQALRRTQAPKPKTPAKRSKP